MDRKLAFFVLALAVAANEFVLSTSKVEENPDIADSIAETSSSGEERGPEQVFMLLGKKIHVNVPGETQQNPITLLGKKIWPVPNEPPPKQLKLLGTTISVPSKQVPEAVAQPASQGNIRNQVAVDVEKTKQRLSNFELGMQPGQTSSAHGKHLSTVDEAGPRDSTVAEEMVHSLRGVKRKVSSVDKAPRPQSTDAQWEELPAHNRVQEGKVFNLPFLKKHWQIDVTQLEQRKEEISKQLEQRRKQLQKAGLPDKLVLSDIQVECMALGSIYFERTLIKLPNDARPHKDLLEKQFKKLDPGLLAQLGVNMNLVKAWASDMFRYEKAQARLRYLVYMAIGKEFYRPVHLLV